MTDPRQNRTPETDLTLGTDRTDTTTRPHCLPPESTAAIARSLREVVAAEAGLRVRVGVEEIPLRDGGCLPQFVITLPAGITDAQRAEADYWVNEIAPMFRYAGAGNPYGGRPAPAVSRPDRRSARP